MSARKHHFLPQAYLRGFRETGRTHLHVLDLEGGRWFRAPPDKVAAERDFNRVEIEGHPPDVIENKLSPFEGEAIEVIRAIDQYKTLPQEERPYRVLMTFVALLAARNPYVRQQWDEIQEDLAKREMRLMVRTREAWEALLSRMRSDGVDTPTISYEDMLSFVMSDKYEIRPSTGHSLSIELEIVDKLAAYLAARNWTLLIAPEDSLGFICSDRPVRVRLTRPRGQQIPVGFGMAGTDVTLPLNRSIALLGRYETASMDAKAASLEDVACVNTNTMWLAKRVFSPKSEFHYMTTTGVHHSSSLTKQAHRPTPKRRK